MTSYFLSIYGFQLIKQPVRSMILFESICCLKEDFWLIEKLISLASKAKVGALLLRNLNPLVNKSIFLNLWAKLRRWCGHSNETSLTMISHDTFRSVLQHFTRQNFSGTILSWILINSSLGRFFFPQRRGILNVKATKHTLPIFWTKRSLFKKASSERNLCVTNQKRPPKKYKWHLKFS